MSPGHVDGFSRWDETTQLVHLIEHGHRLDDLRRLSDDDRHGLHDVDHSHGEPAASEPPDLLALTDKAVQMAAALNVHLQHERWSEAYACADWLGDLASEVKSHVWAAHPHARPDRM